MIYYKISTYDLRRGLQSLGGHEEVGLDHDDPVGVRHWRRRVREHLHVVVIYHDFFVRMWTGGTEVRCALRSAVSWNYADRMTLFSGCKVLFAFIRILNQRTNLIQYKVQTRGMTACSTHTTYLNLNPQTRLTQNVFFLWLFLASFRFRL